jgi:hypothetical protein
MPIDFAGFDELYRDVEIQIEDIYHQIPAEVKNQLDRLKESMREKHRELEPMTDENRKKLWDEIANFLKGDTGDEGAV